MRVRAGTSGFAYKFWKGPFYPADLPDGAMLRYYAERFTAVEINNTFYRMPAEKMLAGWIPQVPPEFAFALKASRRITHIGRLDPDRVADSTAYLFQAASVLGPRLGPILFQLPPFQKVDVPRLEAFLALLPEGRRAAFEFRHLSWFDDAVYAALAARNAALCFADGEMKEAPPFVATADWGYLRMRDEDYSEEALAEWAERVRAQSWGEAFVFFKHEDEGAAPRLASRFLELVAASG